MEREKETRIAAFTTKTGGPSSSGISTIRDRLPTLVPIGILILAVVLPGQMFKSAQRSSDIGLGPAAWPNTMLYGLAFFAFLWIAIDLWALRRGNSTPLLQAPVEEEEYHFGKALVGLFMIIAYGFLLAKIGFAIATVVFIALWCIYGGLRDWKIVVPVALMGTLGLLWLFMGLALMPLPRGQGPFDGFSIGLLRTIGIY